SKSTSSSTTRTFIGITSLVDAGLEPQLRGRDSEGSAPYDPRDYETMLRCALDAVTVGTVNQKLAPPPRRLSTPTRPPWASTMDFTMERPRPTPSLPLPAVAGAR